MAKKGKIPGRYKSTERRSRNERFSEKGNSPNPGGRRRNIERRETIEKREENIRLNKYVANSGVCSRREADSLIEKGEIKVNEKVVTEMGVTVSARDKVEYKGKRLSPEKKVYILLNKPKNTVTTASDPEGRRTVLDLIKNACPQRVYPVGRLDRNTTGILILTNDGELAKKLTHPSFEAKKIYHVFLDKPLSPDDMQSIQNGVKLEDGTVKPDSVNYVDPEDACQVGIEIHSGKNRVVRRIFEHLGYEVEKLDRVFFAGLTKKNLPRGKWRFLDDKEVRFLSAGLNK